MKAVIMHPEQMTISTDAVLECRGAFPNYAGFTANLMEAQISDDAKLYGRSYDQTIETLVANDACLRKTYVVVSLKHLYFIDAGGDDE